MTIPAPTRRRPQWLRVSAQLLRAYVRLMAWFWATVVFFAVVILAVVSRFHEVRLSGMQFAHHGALWYPFTLAIIITSGYLGVHVAAGMTRRSFARACLVAATVVSLLNAVVATLLLLVERAVYDRLGWFQGVASEGMDQAILAAGAPAHALNLFVVLAAGMLSGTLVALAYYRFGGWAGTLALPLTMLPLLMAGLFPVVADEPWSFWQLPRTSVELAGPVITLIVLAAGAAAVVLLSRRVPISTKEA
jgi:hypothetical protein